MLFIDGLHDYFNSQLDFSLWSPYVVQGGIIAFHDAFCGYEGPMKVIEKYLLSDNNYVDIGVVGSIVYARKLSQANWLQLVIKNYRGWLIKLANFFYRQKLPWFFNYLLIHRVIRILLLNKITCRIYLK